MDELMINHAAECLIVTLKIAGPVMLAGVLVVLIGNREGLSSGRLDGAGAILALGVLVLGERLRVLQWIAVGVGAVAEHPHAAQQPQVLDI